MEKRIKDYNSLPSVASSRFESVKKLRSKQNVNRQNEFGLYLKVR